MNTNYKTLAGTTAVLLILLTQTAFAQLPGWNYRTSLTITETDGVSKSDFPIRLIINTTNLVTNGKLRSNGNDLRFADSCANNILNHYIEGGVGTDSTIVWVRLPSLPANSSVDLFMYYGNSTVASGSRPGKTFDNPYITKSKSQSLTGLQKYDYIHIKSTDTLFIQRGSKLTLDSVRYMVVDGFINGEGRGAQPPSSDFTDGNGSGGGTASSASNAGSGGGGYGGDGGDGGYDSGDDRGIGGDAYGTMRKDDIAIGSSGGKATGDAGAGGGCLEVNAETIVINGVINMNGDSATSVSTGGQLGGGGSGGGVKITGYTIVLNGEITADGGHGGDGVGAANDSGGGGGGGRIKIFYGDTLIMKGSMSAIKGDGGIYGSAATGQDGLDGTIYVSDSTTLVPSAASLSTGKEESMLFSATNSETDLLGCEGDTVTITGAAGFGTYSFYQNNKLILQTTSNSHDFYLKRNSDALKVTVPYNSCIDLVDSFVFGVFNQPVINLVEGDSVLCRGDSTKIKVNGANQYEWSHGFGTDREIWVKPDSSIALILKGTSAKNCVSFDTFNVVVNQLPIVSVVGDTAMCLGDTVNLIAQGAETYKWSSGQTNDTITISPKQASNTYEIVGTDINSCVGAITHHLTVNELPEIETAGTDEVCEGDSFSISATGADTYSWSTGESTAKVAGIGTRTRRYTVTGTDQNGCANSKNHRLTVNERPSMTISGDTLVCENGEARLEASDVIVYDWSDGQKGKIVRVSPSSTTTYSVIGSDLQGCKDTAFHTVSVYEVNVAVSTIEGGLSADLADGTYQWLDCDDNYSEITDATEQDYIVPQDGNYAVLVDDGTCADTSACIAGTFVGINNNLLVKSIKLYPNPSNGVYNLSANELQDVVNCKVYSATGQLIQTLSFYGTTQLDLSQEPTGIYTMLLESNGETGYMTMIKK